MSDEMDSKSSWICPNDRELTLRARLETGWSVKSGQLQNNATKNDPINESEQAVILKVLNKAQTVERNERQRIDRMIERLNNMKRNAKGDGISSCLLCNDPFGIFGAQGQQCKDCLKLVCNKCRVDTLGPDGEGLVWLCKLCSETREMWKKSGAWFSRAMPSTSSTSPAHTSSSIPSISSPANGSPNSDDHYLPHSSSFRSMT